MSLSTLNAPATSRNGERSTGPNRRAVLIVGLVAAALTLALNPGWVRDIRDQFIPKRWGVVEPGKIYRSGQISARLIRPMLEDNRIARVVDLTTDDIPEAYHDAEIETITDMGIERKLFPLISDGTGDVETYAAAVASVAEAERQGKPVLVHCAAGTQRTGGVIATYRLLVQKKAPAEVLEEMRKYKYDPVHSPRLREYLNEHMPELASELVRHGTIDQVPEPLPRLPTD